MRLLSLAILGLGAGLSALAVGVGPAPAQPAAAQYDPPVLVRTDVAPGIYQFTAPPDGYVEDLNSLVVINADGVLVFDTFARTSEAEALLREIRKLTDKPVRTIVNSHWHPDHWTGNAVFARAFPGVEIIATSTTADIMRNVAPAWPAVFAGYLARTQTAYAEELRTGKEVGGAVISPADAAKSAAAMVQIKGFVDEQQNAVRTYPTRTYDGALTITRGGRTFRLISMTGDATDGTVLYLPREKVVATGDLIVYPVTWTAQSYRIAPWRASLRTLAGMDARTIVPGHGPTLRDMSYVTLVADLFDSVTVQVRAALAQGKITPDEILPTLDVAALRKRFAGDDAERRSAFDATVKSLVTKTYQEARDGMTSRR